MRTAVSLYAREDVVRAWPGGTGQSKLGANYCAPTRIAAEAQEKGYDQVLWLFGDAAEITEVGAMNILMVFKQDDGCECRNLDQTETSESTSKLTTLNALLRHKQHTKWRLPHWTPTTCCQV